MATLHDEAYMKIDSNGNLGMFYLGRDESAGTIAKIKADQIKFEGLVTANNNFKIMEDGSMETIKGKIGDWNLGPFYLQSSDMSTGIGTGATSLRLS